MSVDCGVPDTRLGVALRISGYLDCQARALGENGFQAMVGGPVAAGLLSGVVTLFVAIIGYRLLLGEHVHPRESVGWALRLGIVLALVTGWPAFQTLVYHVAVDGPVELAAVLLPAAGLPDEAIDDRVQSAYDTIRLGGGAAVVEVGPTDGTPSAERNGAAAAPVQPTTGLGAGQVPRPSSALLLVLTSSGLTAALRLAVGFLLAIAPLAILCLLFEATAGIVAGWASALAGAALAVLATVVVTALELVMVEGEIASVQAYSRGLVAEAVDPEALPVIIACFALVAFIAVAATFRVTRILRPVAKRLVSNDTPLASAIVERRLPLTGSAKHVAAAAARVAGVIEGPSRATFLASSLDQTVRREGLFAGRGSAEASAVEARAENRQSSTLIGVRGFGAAGRRLAVRRTRSAEARDRAR